MPRQARLDIPASHYDSRNREKECLHGLQRVVALYNIDPVA
ncbi:MAG TPA: hypothetical protein PLM71_02075 [Syntrophorhabdaceae bacterium]|nr:hypothetical protein [Syntrophorhabdaceae bacterium]